MGFSFNDAKSIVEAATIKGGGVSATTFGVLLPGRKLTLRGKISSDIFPKAVLRSTLQPDGSLILHQHSGYGSGTKIQPDLSLIMVHMDDDTKGVSPMTFFDRKDKTVISTFYTLLSSFLGYSDTIGCLVEKKLIIAALAPFPPISKEYSPATNARTEIVTTLALAGVGGGNELVRQ